MQLRKLLISDQECRSNSSWKHQYQIDLHFILPCSSVAARVIAILFYHYFGTTLITMIHSHSTCLSSQLQINIGCSYRSALNSYAARDLFTAPTIMKSGLHVKDVNLSDKWLVYPVSFDRIATVALNQ